MALWESIRRLIVEDKETPNPSSKIIKNYGYGEDLEVSFKQLIEYHDKTPQVAIGVTGYAKLLDLSNIQINADDEESKKIIEDWNQTTRFKERLPGIGNTLLICGNAIIEKLDQKETLDVEEVDMRTIVDKVKDDFGRKTLYYIQETNEGRRPLGQEDITKFIEFNLDSISKKKWSPSLFHSIAVPRKVRDRTFLPLIETLWAIEDAMGAIILNNAYPFRIVTFENANDQELDKQAEKLRKYKPGDTWLGTKKPEIELVEAQANSKYTDYIAHIEKTIQLGIKFPHDIMTGDFTSRASSDTTSDITQKIAKTIKGEIADKLKHELYDEILKQKGKDPLKANLTVSFETQNIIELTPDQVLSRVEKKLWTIEEGREWDKNNLGVDLFDDSKIDQMEQDKEDQQNQFQINPEDKQQLDIKKETRKCRMCKEHQHALCDKPNWCRCRHGQ